MDQREESVWVNVNFKGKALVEFLQVQAHLGIETRTDVVRFLVRQMAEQLQRETSAIEAATEAATEAEAKE